MTGERAGCTHKAPEKLLFRFVWDDQLGGLAPARQCDHQLPALVCKAATGTSPAQAFSNTCSALNEEGGILIRSAFLQDSPEQSVTHLGQAPLRWFAAVLSPALRQQDSRPSSTGRHKPVPGTHLQCRKTPKCCNHGSASRSCVNLPAGHWKAV